MSYKKLLCMNKPYCIQYIILYNLYMILRSKYRISYINTHINRYCVFYTVHYILYLTYVVPGLAHVRVELDGAAEHAQCPSI